MSDDRDPLIVEAPRAEQHSGDQPGVPTSRKTQRWIQPFKKDSLPPWPCPRCNTGTLSLRKGSMLEVSSGDTAAIPDYDFDTDFYEGRFTCVADCSRPGCGETVIVTGRSFVESENDDGSHYVTLLTPVCVHPPPPIVPLPPRCPKDVRSELVSAFGLYWMDLRAAANRVRTSVELLLTRLGIQRVWIRESKRRRLTTHERIELFRAKDSELGSSLLAIKWIGNEGSHPGDLKKQDLLDAFELISHVLDETYAKRST